MIHGIAPVIQLRCFTHGSKRTEQVYDNPVSNLVLEFKIAIQSDTMNPVQQSSVPTKYRPELDEMTRRIANTAAQQTRHPLHDLTDSKKTQRPGVYETPGDSVKQFVNPSCEIQSHVDAVEKWRPGAETPENLSRLQKPPQLLEKRLPCEYSSTVVYDTPGNLSGLQKPPQPLEKRFPWENSPTVVYETPADPAKQFANASCETQSHDVAVENWAPGGETPQNRSAIRARFKAIYQSKNSWINFLECCFKR